MFVPMAPIEACSLVNTGSEAVLLCISKATCEHFTVNIKHKLLTERHNT